MILNPADGSRAERVTTGSARRRRERRLRSMLRHERMSVAMALAEKLHHSAYRSVPLKEELVEHEKYDAPTGPEDSQRAGRPRTTRRRPVWPGTRRSSRCTMRKTPCGVRGRPVLVEPRGPQERIQRHTAEPDSSPSCPCRCSISTLLCRRRWTNWWTDNSVPEQVIDVPKISQGAIPHAVRSSSSRSWRNSWGGSADCRDLRSWQHSFQ